ncbi:MAG: mechanosensitive ion channel family protein [Deltaproteobacteria bacterium]|nr:mechanosensitive ion channel family protein [Deltaproteobacteria bacterium]
MNGETWQDWLATLQRVGTERGVPIVLTIVGALALWIFGRIAIRTIVRALKAVLERRAFDATLSRYLQNISNVGLTILLAVAILSVVGVETTSFAAAFAAIGLAIGTAWGGLLANLAAGAFLVVLRPYKVGDMIAAAGITGVVHEIGLFATTIDTADNVRTFVGNNKIFADNIINYTTNPYRRIELTAQLPHGVNPLEAIEKLKARLAKITNVAEKPAPDVDLLEFTTYGPVLAVRPYAHNDHYWPVYFRTNEAIVEVFREAGYPVPETHIRTRTAA